MELNVDKKKVMHLGRNHWNFSYTLVGCEVAELLGEKIRGNYGWKYSLKTSAQSSEAVKANRLKVILIRQEKIVRKILWHYAIDPLIEFCFEHCVSVQILSILKDVVFTN